jgi:uncharacterized membrane protein
MTTEHLVHLAALLGFLLIPGWVFFQAPRNEANRAFALLGLAGAIYNGCCFMALEVPPGSLRLQWARHAYLGAFLLLPLVVRFPCSFLGTDLCPRRPYLEGSSWLLALGFSVLALTGGFLDHLDLEGRASGNLSLGIWTLIVGVAFLDFARVMRRGYRRRRTPELKNRLLYLVLGVVLFAVPAGSDLLHRLGMRWGQPFPLAPLGSLVFLACLGVAVVRHRLLDIEVVVHRGLVLSLVAPSLAVCFVVLGEVLESLFAGTLPPGSPYPNVLAALCVALLFGPLTQFLSQVVESFVIREFKVAPGLRAFRQLPYLIGAEDVEGLQELQGELTRIIGAIERKRRGEDVPPRNPTTLEVRGRGSARKGRKRRRKRR